LVPEEALLQGGIGSRIAVDCTSPSTNPSSGEQDSPEVARRVAVCGHHDRQRQDQFCARAVGVDAARSRRILL
jgi:hypothetical protein